MTEDNCKHYWKSSHKRVWVEIIYFYYYFNLGTIAMLKLYLYIFINIMWLDTWGRYSYLTTCWMETNWWSAIAQKIFHTMNLLLLLLSKTVSIMLPHLLQSWGTSQTPSCSPSFQIRVISFNKMFPVTKLMCFQIC